MGGGRGPMPLSHPMPPGCKPVPCGARPPHRPARPGQADARLSRDTSQLKSSNARSLSTFLLGLPVVGHPVKVPGSDPQAPCPGALPCDVACQQEQRGDHGHVPDEGSGYARLALTGKVRLRRRDAVDTSIRPVP